jgi:hypothetical protein
VIVVVGEKGALIVAVPGLPVAAVHVPIPVAAIVAVFPGHGPLVAISSGPALGLPITITVAVSVCPPIVQMNWYIPGALNSVIVVLALSGEVIVAVPGFPAKAVHTPVPKAAIVAVPPGNIAHGTVWSGPAEKLQLTTVTLADMSDLHPSGETIVAV